MRPVRRASCNLLLERVVPSESEAFELAVRFIAEIFLYCPGGGDWMIMVRPRSVAASLWGGGGSAVLTIEANRGMVVMRVI